LGADALNERGDVIIGDGFDIAELALTFDARVDAVRDENVAVKFLNKSDTNYHQEKLSCNRLKHQKMVKFVSDFGRYDQPYTMVS